MVPRDFLIEPVRLPAQSIYSRLRAELPSDRSRLTQMRHRGGAIVPQVPRTFLI